jgi:hypothetical protein
MDIGTVLIRLARCTGGVLLTAGIIIAVFLIIDMIKRRP